MSDVRRSVGKNRALRIFCSTTLEMSGRKFQSDLIFQSVGVRSLRIPPWISIVVQQKTFEHVKTVAKTNYVNYSKNKGEGLNHQGLIQECDNLPELLIAWNGSKTFLQDTEERMIGK